MKIYLRYFFGTLFLLHCSLLIIAQSIDSLSEQNSTYENNKRDYYRSVKNKNITPNSATKNNSTKSKIPFLANENNSCFVEQDSSYIPVFRNDDESVGPISLPFNFDLYGNSYNQVWINTNGNLTFTNRYREYRPSGFPLQGVPMVAAFWADIDTRNTIGGQIYYKVDSTHLIVTWDHVGYYSYGVDKLNTFQIIIGSLNDSLLGIGNNLKFNYKDIQWATSEGFGGNATTVGANSGADNNYVQVGRFNQDNTDYDGPGGSDDGINYLDDKCFTFNVSNTSNIPPSVSGLPSENPVTVNVGDTINLSPQFIGPEVGQTVTTTVDTAGRCGITYSITNGAVSAVNLRFIADTCNVGSNTIAFTATDNGIPVQSTTVNYTINVNKLNQVITFTPPSVINGTSSITLTATAGSGLPVVYSVISGPGYVSGNTLFFTGVGLITVRASQPGNNIYNSATLKDVAFCITPSQPGVITGNTEVCLNSNSSYSVENIAGANFTWSIDGGGTITSSGNTVSVQWTSLGTHTISVKYTTNCGTAGSARSLPVLVTNKTLSGSFIKMLPSNGNTNIAFPINFSWFPITNAVSYDIYIWPEASSRPASPTISNINGINYTLYSSSVLEFGKTYKWQVLAKSICDELPSPVQIFTLRYLPDLVVSNIQVPSTGFSGQSISIRWTVKNTGPGATLSQRWVDRVYLSKDALLDNQDINLGYADNISELAPGISYVNTATFTLPQGVSDNYYAFVVTDPYNQLPEISDSNNTAISTARSAIQLTPPPDLQVTSIVPPNFAFSGQDINVTWKISNLGTGQTVSTSWTDFIYLSNESAFNSSNANFVGSFNHTGALAVNEFYTQSATFTLPEGIFGAYYIHVVTDVYKQVYEHAQEGNNSRSSDSIHVILTPPIDLVVTQITIPATASNGQNIPISWRVENQGGSSTENHSWRDNVYLSKASVFNEDSLIFLGSFSRPNTLAPGEEYTANANFTIPSNISGPYYIYVKTDVGNSVYEYIFENNNTRRSTSALNVLTPDLIVSNIVAPSADTSGHTININWTVKNSGAGTLFNTAITDRIFLSKKASFNADSSIELKQLFYNTGVLLKDSIFSKQISAKLPNGIAGTYYLYVYTDYYNDAYETFNNNNVKRSSAITVRLGPWPDLQVSMVTAGDSATAGDVVPISFRVINRGLKAVDDPSWTDKIYLSKKSTWDSANSIFIRSANQNRYVAKDSFYTVNASIQIPYNAEDTIYYIYVFADADNDIYEHTAEGNNIKRSSSIHIKKYPPVDLAVTSISAPASGRTGAPITVKWAVKNKGEATTLPGQWSDALFLSTDTIFDTNDRLVREYSHTGTLAPDASYSDEQSFILPNGLAGSYYLLLVTDRSDANNDADRSNNYKLIKQSSSGGDSTQPIPIVIVLTNPPDLVVTKLSTPDEGNAGQPVKVKWTIKNTGIGVTGANAWTEKVYLSDNVVLDGGDRLIGSFAHTGALNPDDAYTDSLEAFLPIDFEGNYILIFSADANDNVYEHGAEENTSIAPITVIKAPLSDLVVTNIQAPQMAMAGDTVTISWMLKNIGVNPANGYMQEGVYLSEDTVKDVTDILLGSPQEYINIGPGAEVSHDFTTELNGVSLRDYHVIIHTDVVNNISESRDTNNVSASPQTMKVTVPTLPVNVLTNRVLRNGKDIYYRIEVPDSLVGESLLIALEGDSLNGSNEIYLRFGEVPTRAVYDYSHSQPYEGDQEIIVPELKTGTYYLLVSGSTNTGSDQPVSLLASILNFEIRTVDADKGGNTGPVTLQIKGSKLGTVNNIRLVGAVTIPAGNITIIDPTKVFATFNLNGALLSDYDIVAQNVTGDTAALANGFTIVPGTAANLVTNVVTPPNTRPSNIISITVEYTNAGNTDLIKPVLKLTSLGGAPIGFNVADLVKNTKELTLSLQEFNGPAGILRPGASGTIIVYAKATTVLGFILLQSND